MSGYVYEFRVRRIRRSCARETAPVTGSADAAALFRVFCDDEPREVFMVASLDVAKRVLGIEKVAVGCMTGVEVHPREVFRAPILAGAAAIVIAHNHPSGDPQPSREDRALTERLRNVGDMLGIPVLDHVIIGDSNYHSMAEREWR